MVIEQHILKFIKSKKSGTVFLTEDFLHITNANGVRVVLSRLVKSGVLYRITNGMYVKPQLSKLLNMRVLPPIESIVKAIAKRDKARIIPTGSYALNTLGLSTQVALNNVYYTDGKARNIKINDSTIVFKKANPKKLALKEGVSMLVVLALSEIGNGNVTKQEEEKILTLLKKENISVLQHNISVAPHWIGEIMAKTLET